MVTLNDYLMGRDKLAPVSDDVLDNAGVTVGRVNELLAAFGEPRRVTSGYRPASINAAVGGAKKSNHMTCQACDLEDHNGRLDAWCMNNLDTLKRIGLWLEHPSATPGWCHVQTVPPKSGNRVFYPIATAGGSIVKIK